MTTTPLDPNKSYCAEVDCEGQPGCPCRVFPTFYASEYDSVKQAIKQYIAESLKNPGPGD